MGRSVLPWTAPTAQSVPDASDRPRTSASILPPIGLRRLRIITRNGASRCEGQRHELQSRNPDVSLIWVCEGYKPFKTGNGILFEVGDAIALEWYARGRKATHDEIMASIEGGLPILRGMAEKEGPDAVAQLEQQVERALAL